MNQENDELPLHIDLRPKSHGSLQKFKTSEKIYYAVVSIGAVFGFVFLCFFMCILVFGITGKLTNRKNQKVALNRTSLRVTELNEQICGRSFYQSKFYSSNGRIIRGEEAVPHSEPWIVSFRQVFQDSSLSTHICGASLIADQFVLLAAHCVENKQAENLAVLVGLHSLSSFTQQNIFYVEHVFVHEGYKSDGKLSNDIAVLKLKEKISESKTVSVVCLPMSDDGLNGQNVIVSGWGNVNDGVAAKYPDTLQTTVLKVINGDPVCSISDIYNPNLTFCTIGEDKQIDSNVCFGDSGGPLTTMNTDNSRYLYGLTSYVLTSSESNGAIRCNADKPSYFTRVAKYLNWIQDKIVQ